MNCVKHKRVLITGAAGGIGHASAVALQAAGANVVGIDINSTQNQFPMLACDITEPEQVAMAVSAAVDLLGGIDVLINNAGVLQEFALSDITVEHIDRVLAVNVKGAILVTQEVLPHLPDGGRIINLASELASLGRENASVYAASKAAVLGLTRSWARELAPAILVNAVAPGPTDTSMLGFKQLSAAQQSQETANPLGRIGQPDEIASAVVFLAGSGASYFTGQCLGPNGGAVMS